MRGWCLKSPSGRLISSTFVPRLRYDRKTDVWSKAYSYLFGRAWVKALWKQYDPFVKQAIKRGWSVVRVNLVEST